MPFSCDSRAENRTDSMTSITIFMGRRKMNTGYSELTVLDSVSCTRFKRHFKCTWMLLNGKSSTDVMVIKK